MLLCKFRCSKSDEPKEKVKLGEMMCPREWEYDLTSVKKNG